MINTSWNMPTDVILKQWLLLWKMWIVSHVVFFLIRNVKTQVHRGSWALTWWQLRNVIYVTTAITSDNLVCEISPLWTNLLFSILQSVFHYFTILWDGLFFIYLLPIFLSQGLFSLIAFVYHIDDIPWSANI